MANISKRKEKVCFKKRELNQVQWFSKENIHSPNKRIFPESSSSLQTSKEQAILKSKIIQIKNPNEDVLSFYTKQEEHFGK